MKKIHPLKRWLFEHQETQSAFAERAEVAESYLSEIISGKKEPTLNAIRRISAATKGALMANDFQRWM